MSWPPIVESHGTGGEDGSPGASRLPRTVLRCERVCMVTDKVWGGLGRCQRRRRRWGRSGEKQDKTGDEALTPSGDGTV